jgi:hypothetical protein
MKKGELIKPLPEHGTIERWRHRVHPCKKCDLCRAAYNTYMRDYRQRTNRGKEGTVRS